MDAKRLRELFVEVQFILKELLCFLGRQIGEWLPVLFRGLLHGVRIEDLLRRFGEALHDLIGRLLVDDDAAPRRLVVVVAKVAQRRHIGQHGETRLVERAEHNEVSVLHKAFRIGRMGDEHVGDARERVDGAVERTRRLRDEIAIELRDVLEEMRHPRMDGAREVCKRDAHLARMRLGVGLEFLVRFEGCVLARDHDDRKQRSATHSTKIGGLERLAARRDIGLQNHGSERREVDACAVGGTIVNLTRGAPHEAIFEVDGDTENLREFRVVDIREFVVGARLERMINRDGLVGPGTRLIGWRGGVDGAYVEGTPRRSSGGDHLEEGSAGLHSHAPCRAA